MVKFLIIFLFLFLTNINNSCNELSLGLFFTDNDIKKLNNGEIITRMYTKNNPVEENTDLFINIPVSDYAKEDYSVYEMISDEKAFFPFEIKDEKDKLTFYNILTAYSKLGGMLYYSRLRGKVEVLILDSFRIDSPSSKKKVDDIAYTTILPKITNYFIQKDNKMGLLTFKSELFNEKNHFIMVNTCLDTISKFMFTMSKKNEYKLITYFIYDQNKKGFYYYSVNPMRIRMEFALKKNKIYTLYPTTFSNRLRGSTIHLAKLMGLDWSSKLNPWDEDMLTSGKYRNYP